MCCQEYSNVKKMVRYLGHDYLHKALEQRRRFLNKALLTVPQHLEHVDAYIHQGKLIESKYRTPWCRASSDTRFLLQECQSPGQEFLNISVQNKHYVESFDSFSSEELGNFDLFEYVPSSNPGSQECFSDLDFILRVEGDKDSKFEAECFEKEDLEDWSVTSDCQYLLLEELICLDSLKNILKQVPDTGKLVDRLHSKQIIDPFAITEDVNFKWKALNSLESLDNIVDKEEVTLNRIVTNTESPVKIDLVTTSGGSLEESLSPIITSNLKEDSLSEVCLKDLVQKCNKDRLICDPIDKDSDLSELIMNKVKSNETLEYAVFSPCEIRPTSFIEINATVEDEEDIFVSKAFLDSPMENTVLYDDKKDLCPQSLCLKQLSLPIETVRFLSPGEKLKIEHKLWEREKVFSDVLALQLPEPETNHLLGSRLSLQGVKTLLSLTREEEIGKLELTLSWDALAFSTPSLLQYPSIEPLKTSAPTCFSNVYLKEKYEKFSDMDLHEWQDAKLDICKRKQESNISLDFQGNLNVEPERPVSSDMTAVINMGISGRKIQRDTSKMNVNIDFDPLNSFMIMRSKNLMQDRQQEGLSSVEAVKRKPLISKEDSNIPRLKKSGKEKCKTIGYTLNGEFKQILKMVEIAGNYFLSAVKESGDILPSHDFKSFTPDVTRFLLKQREKYLDDRNEDDTKDNCLKSIIAVHALCGASEILTNCCLGSAIAHLTAMQEKYQHVLKDSLEKIRQQLFQIKCNFHQNKTLHPKVFLLCQKIEERLEKKILLSPDSEQKILLILKRDLPSLCECLQEALCSGGIVKVKVQTNEDHEDIIKSLDDHNCLIITSCNIKEDFPWAQFSLVVEYEKDEDKFSTLCQRQNIRYLTFILNDQTEQDGGPVSMLEEKAYHSQITVIGSTKLTTQPDLLHILETRYNLLILERNFSTIETDCQLCFADLIIDERTCVLLHSIQDLSEEYQLEPFIYKIIGLYVKYTNCWIILCNNGKKSYQYSNCVVSNLAKLHATMASFTSKQEDFNVEIITSTCAEETAAVVRRICDYSLKTSPVWKQKDWENRQWLKEEMNQAEKILLSIPCVNSFSAQLMLQNTSLKAVLGLTYKELVSKFPWIPVKIAKMFVQLINSNTGLELRDSPIIDSINTKPSDMIGESPVITMDICQQKITRDQSSVDEKHLIKENSKKSDGADEESVTNSDHLKQNLPNCYTSGIVNAEKCYTKQMSPLRAKERFLGNRNWNIISSNNGIGKNNSYLGNQQEFKYHIDNTGSLINSGFDSNRHQTNDTQNFSQDSNISMSLSQNTDKPNEFLKAELEGRLFCNNNNQSLKFEDQFSKDFPLYQVNFNYPPSYQLSGSTTVASQLDQPHMHQLSGREYHSSSLCALPNEKHFKRSLNFDTHSSVLKEDEICRNIQFEKSRNSHSQDVLSAFDGNFQNSGSVRERYKLDNDIHGANPIIIGSFQNSDRPQNAETNNFKHNTCSEERGIDIPCVQNLAHFYPSSSGSGMISKHLDPNSSFSSSEYFSDRLHRMPKPMLGGEMQDFNRSQPNVEFFNSNRNGPFNNETGFKLVHDLNLNPKQEFSQFERERLMHEQEQFSQHQRPFVQEVNSRKQNLHPEMEKIQQPEIYRDNVQNSQSSRNLIKDLSETTRNILRHAYTNNNLGKQPRQPIHRISIGLAQPQPRAKDTQTAQNNHDIRSSQMNIQAHNDHQSMVAETSGHLSSPQTSEDLNCINSLTKQNEISQEILSKSDDVHSLPSNCIDYESVRENRNLRQLPDTSIYEIGAYSQIKPQGFYSTGLDETGMPSQDFGHVSKELLKTQNQRHMQSTGLHENSMLLQDRDYGPMKKSFTTQRDLQNTGLNGKSVYNKCMGYGTAKQSDDLLSAEGHRLWSSYDSPPMDFESETPFIDDHLDACQNTMQSCTNSRFQNMRKQNNINNGSSNRKVFKADNSTPHKRRKLTYHKTPGSKGGQTKLVFM